MNKATKIAIVVASSLAAFMFFRSKNFTNLVPDLLLLKRTAPQPVLDSSGQPIPGTGPV